MKKRLLIYGATGYTGTLLAEVAHRRDMRPILAGRDRAKVDALTRRLEGADSRVFPLEDRSAVLGALNDVGCVIHAAGPFTLTARPMIDACLTAGVHYLDITGEFAIFELAESLSDRAAAAGVMLMPGVGWDVIPSDCLALHTVKRISSPHSLKLFLKHFGGISRGSAKSGVYIAATGPRARRNGVVVSDPRQPMACDFGSGLETCVPFPMGDIITGWKAHQVPNVDVFFSVGVVPPGPAAEPPVGSVRNFDDMPDGPTAAERDAGRSQVIAEVMAGDGTTVRSRIETASGYSYTSESGVEVARRVLDGNFVPGFQGPASAYGELLAVSIGESVITDLE